MLLKKHDGKVLLSPLGTSASENHYQTVPHGNEIHRSNENATLFALSRSNEPEGCSAHCRSLSGACSSPRLVRTAPRCEATLGAPRTPLPHGSAFDFLSPHNEGTIAFIGMIYFRQKISKSADLLYFKSPRRFDHKNLGGKQIS